MSGFRPTCPCGCVPFSPVTGLCATCEDELADLADAAKPSPLAPVTADPGGPL